MALNSSIKGTFWSFIERFSTMGIQLLCTLVIAQFLSPSEFGLIGMMSIFLAFSSILVDAGFGQAIIRDNNVSDIDCSSVFYFNILLGIIIYAVVWFCAPIIARFYVEPQLTALVRVSFLSLVIQSFSVVQQARLFKSVNFATVSRVSLISVIISGIIGIVVAYVSKNVWALVCQSLSYSLLRAVLLWVFSSWMPQRGFSYSSIKKYLKFSLNLLGSNLIAAITDNLANLFIGKSYSAQVLGNYTIPDKLQRSIAGTLSFSIHRVSYPIMSSFQDDDDHLRNYSQNVVGMAFYIIAPIMLFLGMESEDFFNLILPPAWKEAAGYFKYMSIIGAIFCFADINMDILLVKGKSDWVFRIEVVRKTLLVTALVIGIKSDLKILLQYLIAYNVFNAVLVSYYAGKSIGCSLWYQFKKNIKTLLNLTAMVVAVVAAKYCTDVPVWRLSLSLIAGLVAYLVTSSLFENPYFDYILSTIKSARENKSGKLIQ